MALVLPTVTLTMAGRAEAQVTQLPTWAVTEFRDLKGANSFKYGQVAADAVTSELAKTNRYDVVPQESIKRSIETLGLSSPLESLVNLSRVGQDVRASTIAEGQILDYQVRAVGGGKQAIVVLRMVAYDVISGLPVNGALERGESTVRGGNVTNDVLVNDAIGQAAALAVRTMQGQQLPTATVLNTTTKNALINQGTRSGFKTGDTVIITRGNQQVGTGRIGVIEPDQAEMSVERVQLGLAPGDRVRAVFTPPPLPIQGHSVINNEGNVNVPSHGRRGNSNNATLISALLVVGLVAVLLGGGNAAGTEAVTHVTAQATIEGANTPAVYINWSPNGFFKGSGSSGNGVARWQIYRSQTSSSSPVLVVGNQTSAVDSQSQDNSQFPTTQFQSGQVGGTLCTFTTPSTGARTAPPLLTPGTPYFYSVEAVYKVSSFDLPGQPTSSAGTSSAGTTSAGSAGTTSAGTTSAGSAGTTSAGSSAGQTSAGTTSSGTTSSGSTTSGTTEQSCYFQSQRSTSGQATPLRRPTITASAATVDSSAPNVTFTPGGNITGGVPLEYIVEFSSTRTFDPATTVRTGAFSTATTLIPTNGSLFNKKLPNNGGNLLTASPVYYRVGVRNPTDRPGPKPEDKGGPRYIFSSPATVGSFTRTSQQFP